MKQMIRKSREDNNKSLMELKKEIQNMDTQHRKALESSKMFQIKIQEIKTITESMGRRSDQCEV